MAEGITTTQSLGNTGYAGKKNTEIDFENNQPRIKQASATLSGRLSKKEKRHVQFSPYGEPPHEDADMWFIEMWSGQYREEYERDEHGNLYSGQRFRGHLPKKIVVRRYPHMIPVPVEEHCNVDLNKCYDKGFMLEEDMPEDVRKDLNNFRRRQNVSVPEVDNTIPTLSEQIVTEPEEVVEPVKEEVPVSFEQPVVPEPKEKIDLDNMEYNQLKKLAAKKGIKKVNISKKDLINVIRNKS